MASHHAIKIKPLNRDNFDTWKIQMKALLIKNETWGYVTRREKVKPEVLANDPISAAVAKLWEREDQKAISNIVLSINPSELKRIKNCEMANEVWRTLQTTYQSTGPVWKATLLKQLTLHKMGKDIREHLNYFFDNFFFYYE